MLSAFHAGSRVGHRQDTAQDTGRTPAGHRPGHQQYVPKGMAKKLFTLLDLCVSSLRRGHANLLCIVPILTDDPRRESISQQPAAQHNNCEKHPPICTTKSIAPLAGQSTQRGNRNKKPKPPNFICDRTNQQDSGQISVDRSTTVYSHHLQSLSPTKSSANGYSTPKPG